MAELCKLFHVLCFLLFATAVSGQACAPDTRIDSNPGASTYTIPGGDRIGVTFQVPCTGPFRSATFTMSAVATDSLVTADIYQQSGIQAANVAGGGLSTSVITVTTGADAPYEFIFPDIILAASTNYTLVLTSQNDVSGAVLVTNGDNPDISSYEADSVSNGTAIPGNDDFAVILDIGEVSK